MANERWRSDERQRWDPDRDRYRREGTGRQDSGRQDFGRREGQRYDWERSDYGRSDYGQRDTSRQDHGRDESWQRAYGRDRDRDDYGRSSRSESSSRGENWDRGEGYGRGERYGRDDRYGRRAYGSGTGYQGYGYGSGYGSSNYSEPSRERDWSSDYSRSGYRPEDNYDRERYAWNAGLAEWPAPIADWRSGYRDDYRRAQDYREQRSDRDWRGGGSGSDRGWWDRTKDEVRSWMGDEEADRRRRMDMQREGERRGHTGRGPKGYARSDQRILEDVSDRLTEDWAVDASEIEVSVTGCEVTLSGTVDSRETRRRAENIAADVTGVKDVQNNLRVRQPTSQTSVGSNLTGSSSAAMEQTTGLSSSPTSSSATSGSTSQTSSSSTRPKH